MGLDLDSLGAESAPHVLTYDWQQPVLYALGVGARRDELAYLYEGRGDGPAGPRVLPSFAVVPAYPAVDELLSRVGGNRDMIVHQTQGIRLHAPIPPAGKLTTTGKVTGLYDMKRFAQAVYMTETRSGEALLFETTWTILFRDDGGFGGPRPPRDKPPTADKGAAPSWELKLPTSPEQALLYRLSGDLNPLHADPEFARHTGFDEPILHGLCTYGYVARALLKESCGGDEGRLVSFDASFKRPVLPGDTLVVRGWHLEHGTVALQAAVDGKDEPVLTAWASVRPGT